MSFTINGTTLEQTASPATLSDLVGLTNVVSTANNTIVDTSAYTDVKITGDFILEGTLIVQKFTIANTACNVYVGTNAAGDTLKSGYLAVVNGSSTAIQPRKLNFDFVFKNSTLDFVGGGIGGYYDGGYLYDLDGCVVVGNGNGAIGINAGSVLKNTKYINMDHLGFFGNPADTTGFVIDGSTEKGAFIDQFTSVVGLTKFSSPRYVVQRRGKFALTDCKITEFIACRFNPTINQTFFTFLKTIKTAGIGANANASTTRYIYDAAGSLLSQASLSANGELTEAIQWGKVQAYDLGANTNMNTLANKMTPAMINTNTGTYQHMTGEYKLPLSVSHVSYLGELLTLDNINFDVSSDEILTDFTLAPNLLDDPNITELNKAVTDAYTSLGTPQKLYDRAKSYLADNYAGESSTIVSRSGSTIDAGSYNVTIDATAGSAFAVAGSTITIKASAFTGTINTTGTLTLANGSIINGSFTNISIDFATAGTYNLQNSTFSGTLTVSNSSGGAVTVKVLPGTTVVNNGPNITVGDTETGLVTAPNIIDGSRYQLYNVTQTNEIANGLVSGGSGLSLSVILGAGQDALSGDTIRLRVTYQSGTSAKNELEATALITSAGVTFLDAQTDNEVYNSYGIDGSTITQFSADYVADEVDITVASNFNIKDLYSWWVYNETTAQGINEFFGVLTALDQANLRINSSLLNVFIDNTTSTNIWQNDNVRIFREDGNYPVKNPATSGGGGVDIVWRNQIFIAETGVSGLTATESSTLLAIPTNPLLTNDSRLDTFDTKTNVKPSVSI